MATLAVPIHNAEEAFNPNAVKVVLDAEGYALYFSRATIPWDRDRFAKGLETVGDNFPASSWYLWLPCRLYPSLRQLAAKSVRTHRNVRAASCSVVRRKNPCCCRPGKFSAQVWIPLKISSAFALKCANFTSRHSSQFWEECRTVTIFPQFFLFNN